MTLRRIAAPAALGLLLGLVLSACSDDVPEDAADAVEDGPRYVVQPLSEVAARAGGSAAADVVPQNDSTISAELTATVSSIAVDVGDRVTRGDVLLTLDPTDYRLQLNQADAQVAAAKAASEQADARLTRARDLHGKHFVSDDDLSAASTTAEAAAAELRIRQAARAVAARQLDKASINAPFDGVVVQRMAQVGAAVAPGAPLMRLIDLAQPQVEARLQPVQAVALSGANNITLTVGDQRYPLVVAQIAAAADPGSRTRVARLDFSAEHPEPGLSGTLNWTQRGFELSSSLLVQRDVGFGLFSVRDGKAHWIPVPGAEAGRSAMVDLPADLPVVTYGQQSLKDGDAVVTARKPEPAVAADTGTDGE
ncbi:MAG: efflux RND transporter periplasmic adaptor subunit [Xanthomonadales bacterium]|nr:efflux RND transporter periplasmic adaptor subunit [Xanthomonadales bacterium]